MMRNFLIFSSRLEVRLEVQISLLTFGCDCRHIIAVLPRSNLATGEKLLESTDAEREK